MDVRVNGPMNRMLQHEFIKKEIKEAHFQMNSLEALGPDGFLALFYQRNWSTVGKEVSLSAIAVLNHNLPLYHVDNTYNSDS